MRKASDLSLLFMLGLFSSVAIVLPGKVSAQYGVKIGMTLSNFYYTGSYTPYKDFDVDLRPFLGNDIELIQTSPQQPLLAPYFGIYRTLQLTPAVGFRPELSFTQKGVKFTQLDYEKVSYQVKISCLEMPFSMTFRYRNKTQSEGDIYIGAYASYRIRAEKKVALHGGPATRSRVNSVRELGGGLHAGIDFKQKIFDHYWLIDLRLFLGLGDTFALPENWTSIYYETKKVKVTGMNLSVGYEF